MTSLSDLIEQVEAALIRATSNHFITGLTEWREEAAEYAAILTSLRALQEKDIEHG